MGVTLDLDEMPYSVTMCLLFPQAGIPSAGARFGVSRECHPAVAMVSSDRVPAG